MVRAGGEPIAVGGGVTVKRGFSSMIDESVDEEADEAEEQKSFEMTV